MPLPLPNLDDRKWADLIEEGRALIPFYAPEWTDHNVHDPGITLLELFAWLVEMDIYQLNRIPESHRRKFLALAGIYSEPPEPAKTVLSFSLLPNINSLELPASVEFEGKDPFGKTTPFLTQYPITIVAVDLVTIQLFDGSVFREIRKEDNTWQKFPVFGATPTPGSCIYFGFSKDLFECGSASLYFKIAGLRKDMAELIRIINEIKASNAICKQQSNFMCNQDRQNENESGLNNDDKTNLIIKHHSVETIWEFLTSAEGTEKWEALSSGNSEIFDDTRAFTLDGRVILKIPKPMSPKRLGKIMNPQYYVRCRFDSGEYDSPPVIQNIIMNAIPAEQAVPVGEWKLTIAADVSPSGPPPEKGTTTKIQLALDQEGIVRKLSFEPNVKELPKVFVLDYKPPTPEGKQDGWIILEKSVLGKSDESPLQKFVLDQKPAVRQNFKLASLEKDSEMEESVWNYVWHEWELKYDLDASSRVDSHYILDPTEGEVIFGDGERGRVPPLDSWIVVDYRTTRAEAGNLSAHVVDQLTTSLHNSSVIDVENVKSKITKITNPIPAVGGTAAETLTQAQGRVMEMTEKTQRAITLMDIEKLAMETPGVELARVAVWANLHSDLPCFKAPGVVTVVVMPNMPVAKPEPGCGLLSAVKKYLNHSRIVGMRLNIVGPKFREIKVQTTVKAFAGIEKNELGSKISEVLKAFLDPRIGGPDGMGWPLGRDVYRSEILQIIDQVEGVDHVELLQLVADGGEPQCGNIPLCPIELVTSDNHAIEVTL